MDINDSVVATFVDHTQAEIAVKKLTAAGFDMKQLSVIGRKIGQERDQLVPVLPT